MALSYHLIQEAFPETKGFVQEDLLFETVSFVANIKQPKGLFIPIQYETFVTDLKQAINNGAIGAVWEKGEKPPSYTPNHFPIFYTNDLKEGLQKMIAIYEKQLNNQANSTNFIFSKDLSLNQVVNTYDIAVIKEQVSLLNFNWKGEE